MVNPRFVIKAVLSGQRLNINVPLTVAGTVNYIGVEAKCTSEWDDCTVVCYLYQAGTGYTAQLGLIYDAERKLYYFPNAERLTLTAGEWAVWFVGVMAESGQETYRVTSDTRYFSVYPNPFASSIPPGDISLDEEAIARATDAQNKANLLLDKYNAGELTGPQGEPGDPAHIGFVQASVDNTTTDPRCTVTVTESPDNTYNMQFAFAGIKGAKGDTGATGPKGDTGAQGAPGRDGTDGRDGVDGQTIDDYVLVQAEQPTSETNKMWLKPTASGDPVMIPTLEEFEDLYDDINEKADLIDLATIVYQPYRRYTAGEYCVYEGAVYVCKENITVFEEWTPSHWRKILVTDELPTGAFDDYLIPGISGGISETGASVSSSKRSRTLYIRANKGDVLILPVNEGISFSIFRYELNTNGTSYTFIDKTAAMSRWDGRKSRYIAPSDCYIRVLEQTPVANFVPIILRRSVPGITLQKMKEESFDMLIDSARSISYLINSDGTITADSTNNRKSSRLIFMDTGDIMYCDNSNMNITVYIYNVKGEFLYQCSPSWARYANYTFFKADKPMFIRFMEQTTDSAHTWSNCHIIRNLNQKVHEINWKNNKFLDISHQGFRDEAPASTVAAYVRAKAKGYNAMEGDIRFTSDGIAVISHNDAMPSDSTYSIASHTLAEIRANANMGTYRGEAQPIMTFEEWLVLSIELDMTPIIEFKADPTSAQLTDLINMCVHLGLIDRLYWMVSTASTSAVYAQTLLSVNSRCRLAFINTTTVSNITPYVDSNDPSKVIIYTRTENVTSALMTAASEANIPVMTWAVTFTWQYPDFTTKQVIDEILRVIDLGVAGICMDNWTASELIRLKYIKYLDYDQMNVDPQ